MAKLIKQVRLDKDVINAVAAVAEADHSGNFTAAVESLLNQSLLMRCIDVQTRLKMYDHVKQSEYARTKADCGAANVRQLIDALHI